MGNSLFKPDLFGTVRNYPFVISFQSALIANWLGLKYPRCCLFALDTPGLEIQSKISNVWRQDLCTFLPSVSFCGLKNGFCQVYLLLISMQDALQKKGIRSTNRRIPSPYRHSVSSSLSTSIGRDVKNIASFCFPFVHSVIKYI